MTPSTSFRAALFAITLLTLGQTATASETVIQNFGTAPDGTAPSTPLVADASGNLYGAAAQGGKYGQGVVYELSPPAATGTSWTETTIYSFPPSKGIAEPQGALVKGSNGVLYGTATVAGSCAVFQLTPPAAGLTAWTETDLYRFTGQNDCAGAIITGSGGVLYGALPYGGTSGTGTIFKLTPPASGATGWTMTSVYAFGGCTASTSNAPGNLVAGPGGVLYGITAKCGDFGTGAVFKLTPPSSGQTSWTESELYSFAADSVALTSLSIGTNGVLYGTLPVPYGSGAIAALSPPASGQTAWTQTVIYIFDTVAGGSTPVASVIPGAGGSLYGTTTTGGAYGYGTAFKLSPPASGKTQWRETVLHSFTGADGGTVATALVKGPGGLLYGAASIGGASGNGTVFSLTLPTATHPAPVETPLYAFSGVAAVGPNATLVGDGTGALYGISGSGNSAVFKLTPPSTGQTAWAYEQLGTFGIGKNLGTPQASLIVGKNGVLYGGAPDGTGQLFMLSPPAAGATSWTKTNIPIPAASGGIFTPIVSLVEGPDGTLYGVTGENMTGSAVVFALTPPSKSNNNWSGTPIFMFPRNLIVENYFLTIGPDGTLYGTSSFTDSTTSPESGNVFKLTPPPADQGPYWTQTILYSFTGGADGSMPNGPVLVGSGGVLYGTTLYGGGAPGAVNPFDGNGTVFALTPPAAGQTAWTESVLYRFAGGLDGSIPQSTLLKGKDGALYGITSFGGEDAASYNSASGNGTVFKLTPPANAGGTWAHSIVHRFVGGRDGTVPLGGLVLNTDGKLYGTTVAGGGGGNGRFTLGYPFGNPTDIGYGYIYLTGSGTVFQIAP